MNIYVEQIREIVRKYMKHEPVSFFIEFVGARNGTLWLRCRCDCCI